MELTSQSLVFKVKLNCVCVYADDDDVEGVLFIRFY